MWSVCMLINHGSVHMHAWTKSTKAKKPNTCVTWEGTPTNPCDPRHLRASIALLPSLRLYINYLSQTIIFHNPKISLKILHLRWEAWRRRRMIATWATFRCRSTTRGTPWRTTRTCPSGSSTNFSLSMACQLTATWLTREISPSAPSYGRIFTRIPNLLLTAPSTTLVFLTRKLNSYLFYVDY